MIMISSRSMKSLSIILLGVTLHLVLFMAVFDIYFKSPVLRGVDPVKNPLRAPCQRLVLVVCDGLRADKLFEGHLNRAPFLRGIIEKHGSWGISKTRVPTESRPGHVAIISGIYEDPSAVFKGWKENPVDVDSVFNQTYQTFAWGSPDIVPMFARGSAKNRVVTESYSSKIQDFFGKSSALNLNDWVFNKFKNFVKAPPKGVDLNKDKTLFFLHLLSTDVIGHVDKPGSEAYLESITQADQITRDAYTLTQEIFEDPLTSFIFTSDHGMTDWGSHGAGSDEETLTPLVAWGCGIRHPDTNSTNDSPADWGLSNFSRLDVSQADIAPLMSILLGISIPVNSVGILPITYLNSSSWTIARSLYVNAKQILAQYEHIRNEVEQFTFQSLFFEFPLLSLLDKETFQYSIERSLNKSYSQGIVQEISQLLHLGLLGIDYYQNYFSSLKFMAVTSIYLAWALVLVSYIISFSGINPAERQMPVELEYLSYATFFYNLFGVFRALSQNMAWEHYNYIVLPIILWIIAIVRLNRLNMFSKLVTRTSQLLKTVIVYVPACSAIVYSFTHREILSVLMLALAFWPFSNKELRRPSVPLFSWFVSCLGLAVFPFFPTVGFYQSFPLVLSAGIIWLLGGLVVLKTFQKFVSTAHLKLCLLLLVFAVYNLFCIDQDFGVPFLGSRPYFISWFLLGVSLLISPLGADSLIGRYIGLVFALSVPYLLLSISHEAFFTLFLSIALGSWVVLEHQLSGQTQKFSSLTFSNIEQRSNTVSLEDIRRSYFLLLFIIMSFFGIGNIASVNSFDVTWVKAFVEIFSPFLMMTLILLKTIIPIFMVAVAFRFVNLMTKVDTKVMFLLVLLICHLMSLHFFYQVSNKGSWLQIGTSISHFVIMQSFTFVMAILYWAASAITYSRLPYPISLEAPMKKIR